MSASAPSRATVGLLVFALLNALVINACLASLPVVPRYTTTLDYSRAFFERAADSDSWKAMRTALFYVDTPRAKPLYTAVYFDNNVRFQYPPSSLLPLEALRHLPIGDPIGNATLNAISWWLVWILAFVVARIFYLSRRRFGEGKLAGEGRSDLGREVLYSALAVFLTLTFYPIVRAYNLGQIQIWIDVLIAGVIWAWLEDRRRVAGGLVALICVIKPTLALVVVWGVVRRHWDFVVGFAVPMSCFALLALGMYGWENHVDYLRVLSYISRQGEIFHPNQSMNGLLHRALHNGDSIRWSRDVLMTYNPWVHAGTVVSSLALLGVGLGFGYRRAQQKPAAAEHDAFDLAIVILCSTLAAPTVWTHHYGVTLPIFALALPAAIGLARQGAHWPLVGLAAAYLPISNTYRFFNRTADTGWNFLQSYVYFGGLVLLVVLCLLLRRSGSSAQDAHGVGQK